MQVNARSYRSWPVAAVLTLGVAAVVCAGEGRIGSDLLGLLPALLIGAALFARRYPGERLLIACRTRPTARRSRPGLAARPLGRHFSAVPRGGLLIAFALAVRPPPPLAPAS
jgi:hypothetical protein